MEEETKLVGKLLNYSFLLHLRHGTEKRQCERSEERDCYFWPARTKS